MTARYFVISEGCCNYDSVAGPFTKKEALEHIKARKASNDGPHTVIRGAEIDIDEFVKGSKT